MTPAQFTEMLCEIRFIERDLQEIACNLKKLIYEIEDAKKRELCS